MKTETSLFPKTHVMRCCSCNAENSPRAKSGPTFVGIYPMFFMKGFKTAKSGPKIQICHNCLHALGVGSSRARHRMAETIGNLIADAAMETLRRVEGQ